MDHQRYLDGTCRHYSDHQFVPTSSGAIATPKAQLAIDVIRFDVSPVTVAMQLAKLASPLRTHWSLL
jgi:hypothetical protein